jgi:tetratricopeptide (TPR) repeat protein
MKRYADHSYPQQMLAVVKLFARDFFEAEKHYRHLVETDRNGGANFYGSVSNLSALGFLRDRAGDHAAGRLLLTEAIEVDRRALARGPGNRDVLYDLAAIQGASGDREKCFLALDRAVEAGWIDYRSLSMDPRFDFVREDSRFQKTLSGLAAKVARLIRQQPAYK